MIAILILLGFSLMFCPWVIFNVAQGLAQIAVVFAETIAACAILLLLVSVNRNDKRKQ